MRAPVSEKFRMAHENDSAPLLYVTMPLSQERFRCFGRLSAVGGDEITSLECPTRFEGALVIEFTSLVRRADTEETEMSIVQSGKIAGRRGRASLWRKRTASRRPESKLIAQTVSALRKHFQSYVKLKLPHSKCGSFESGFNKLD
jgi:hypothetical protein